MMPDDNLILSALAGEVQNRTRRTRGDGRHAAHGARDETFRG